MHCRAFSRNNNYGTGNIFIIILYLPYRKTNDGDCVVFDCEDEQFSVELVLLERVLDFICEKFLAIAFNHTGCNTRNGN